jgi:hypothetical protein
MPYERPGAGVYVTATKTTPHNAPATENGIVGIAVKQKAISWKAGWSEHVAASIAIGEQFHIRTKGIRQVLTSGYGAAIAAGTKGQGVFIRPSDNSLRLEGATAAGDLPFGRIVEVVGDNRGVPTGKVRIDLDLKESLAIAS